MIRRSIGSAARTVSKFNPVNWAATMGCPATIDWSLVATRLGLLAALAPRSLRAFGAYQRSL